MEKNPCAAWSDPAWSRRLNERPSESFHPQFSCHTVLLQVGWFSFSVQFSPYYIFCLNSLKSHFTVEGMSWEWLCAFTSGAFKIVSIFWWLGGFFTPMIDSVPHAADTRALKLQSKATPTHRNATSDTVHKTITVPSYPYSGCRIFNYEIPDYQHALLPGLVEEE